MAENQVKPGLRPDPSKTEPLRAIGTVTAAVAAIMGLLVSFGLPITPAVRDSIVTVIATCGPLVVLFLGRRKVFSPAKAHQLLSARGVNK